MTNEEFEKIYKAYFDIVYRYLLNLTKNKQITEDITSDTFFKAINSIDSFNGKCDMSSWLCQIAKNTYFSYLRKNNKLELTDIPDDKEDTSVTKVEDKLINNETTMTVYEILHKIEEPYKEVFLLRAIGELSFKQIAKIFGKTENWACVTYHRAKRKIQIEMEDY